jgi:hypothetical protein
MFKISFKINKQIIKEEAYYSKNIFKYTNHKLSFGNFSKIKKEKTFKRNYIKHFSFNNYSQISKMEIEDKKNNNIGISGKQNKKDLYDEYHDFSDSENNEELEVPEGVIRQNMPKKSKYRMRAHINPLSEITVK